MGNVHLHLTVFPFFFFVLQLDILSPQVSETVRPSHVSQEALLNQCHQVKSACDPSQTLLPVNGTCSASHPNSSVEQEDKSKGSSFVLPDLNLPFDDDISSGILYGVS